MNAKPCNPYVHILPMQRSHSAKNFQHNTSSYKALGKTFFFFPSADFLPHRSKCRSDFSYCNAASSCHPIPTFSKSLNLDPKSRSTEPALNFYIWNKARLDVNYLLIAPSYKLWGMINMLSMIQILFDTFITGLLIFPYLHLLFSNRQN